MALSPTLPRCRREEDLAHYHEVFGTGELRADRRVFPRSIRDFEQSLRRAGVREPYLVLLRLAKIPDMCWSYNVKVALTRIYAHPVHWDDTIRRCILEFVEAYGTQSDRMLYQMQLWLMDRLTDIGNVALDWRGRRAALWKLESQQWVAARAALFGQRMQKCLAGAGKHPLQLAILEANPAVVEAYAAGVNGQDGSAGCCLGAAEGKRCDSWCLVSERRRLVVWALATTAGRVLPKDILQKIARKVRLPVSE